ncbi:malonate decarboxylase holo-ACP synthase [Gordonia sp. CPCC 205515]|uniref:malonate decarboxylase holo-ACP synthase n=1 Tax=Gordonia sp. CPCC 205515 TaxID=3140791 RepID=UPI003AF34316
MTAFAEPPAEPHDLVRVADTDLLTDTAGATLSDDASRALAGLGGGWVVVRRAAAPTGMLPVGIRGRQRSERHAALLPVSGAAERVRPWQIRSTSHDPTRPPALTAFRFVTGALGHSDLRWGPAGSVAFELVTGTSVATETSDLDLIVDAPQRLSTTEMALITDAITKATDATGTRIDVQLVTPGGGVAFTEVARGDSQVALRTVDGPILCTDPWDTSACAVR